MRIFITGGTGLIGTRLIQRLRERQESVVLLTRRPSQARERFGSACTLVEGDPMQAGAWMDAVRDCDAVVNLAGEGIFNRRWNDAFKTLLRASRVQTTEHVVAALARSPRTPAGNPKILVSASAIGYYGCHEDEELTEEDAPGTDTLARMTVDWEKAAQAAEPLGVRVVRVRIGVVQDKEGGALAKMLLPFKLGAGGPIGSGRQWVSWIHHADMTGLLVLALNNPNVQGPMNATAPNPVPNKELSKALGRALHRPSFVPTPGFALKLMLGEVADVIGKGQRVLPQRALALGYAFQFPTIDAALADILK